MQPLNHSAGFFLLEALIALFVFSVGFLGLGTFQLMGLQASREAGFRGQATEIAQELAERIHANASAAMTENYAGPYPGTPCTASIVPYCSDAGAVTGSLCTPAEMALFDVHNVFCSSSDSLPGLAVQVQCNEAPCNSTSSHRIIVSWQKTGRTSLTTQAYCPAGSNCIALHLVP